MDIDDAFLLGSDFDSEQDVDAPQHDPFGLGVEMFDLDGDGISETRVARTEAGVTVATDRDGDTVMDTFSAVARDGHYESWEVFRAADGTSQWKRTDSGELFE